ncbi:MAG TPA: carboxypeptidase regulatory-like domain-containing protein [Bryobacteraceae bacterium]|nr:carboxypeptidase regulatory-like domain-containing protein [Bryobacteraceae bacterium]
MCSKISTATAFLGVAFLAGSALFGQSQATTGTIEGTVTDPSGALVPNAAVTVKNTNTGNQRTAKSNADGHYSVPLLEVGDYEVTAAAPGFATVVSRGFTLTLGKVLVADIALKVGATTDTVTVEAQAPVVETASSLTSSLVDPASAANLPLNGRRFMDLALLTPGVMVEPERNTITFAGSRGINTSINVDGTNYNEPFFGGQAGGERANSAYTISQAAIDQFQIVRGTFDPEYGGTTGGMLNVITKSGTNQFHGQAFEYFRHKSFAPVTILGDRVATTRNQFGGAVGGPVKKDKLFFFAVYDGSREKIPGIIRFNSTSGLPPSFLSQQGLFQSTNDVNTFLGKVDWQLSDKHRAYFRYSQSGNNGVNGTFTGVQTGTLQNNGTEQDFTHVGVANLTSAFSPALLNEFRFQYRIEDRPRVNNFEDLSFTNVAGPQTQITGCCFFGGVSFLPIPVTDSTLQFSNSTTWIHGSHTVKFGVDVHRAAASEVFRGNWRGVYIFNNITSFANVLNKAPGAEPDQFRIFYGDGNFSASIPDVGAFIQDSWKVNRRITISGGLRYDAWIEPTPPRPNPQLPLTGQIPSDVKEFQPRLGLALDLTGDGKTVLRAGAGIFFAGTPALLLNQVFNSSGNTSVGVSFQLSPAQIAAVQTVHPEFVYPFVPPSANAADSTYFSGAGITGLKPDASFFAPDFANPHSLNFNVGLERQVTGSMSIAIDWVHSNTVHLERIRDINFFSPVVGADNSTPPQQRPLFKASLRPNPNYGRLLSQESTARSNYDGLTLLINKRMSRRLQFQVNGTLAWSYDNDSNERNFSGVTYQDAFCLDCEYTYSRDDIRRRMGASGIYQLPFGFQISGLMTWRTGLPFTAFTGVDSNTDGNFTDRPYINGVSLPRNSFRQPNYWSTDLRVSKEFRVTERQRVEFSADLFNAFNKTNFSYSVSTNESTTTALGSVWGKGQSPAQTFRTIYLPNGALNVGGISVTGSSSSSGIGPFQLQLALKYVF